MDVCGEAAGLAACVLSCTAADLVLPCFDACESCPPLASTTCLDVLAVLAPFDAVLSTRKSRKVEAAAVATGIDDFVAKMESGRNLAKLGFVG